MSPDCPLCRVPSSDFMAIARGRDQAPGDIRYQKCGHCLSVFMHPADRMERSAERKRYDAHENEDDQAGYLQYLEPLREKVVATHEPSSRGLDFGCGPNPVLARALENAGFSMRLYDPYFGPDELPRESTFDFVTATEVIEHLHDPAQEFERLRSLLKPGGSLWLMTQLWHPQLDFRKWHYRRDPTHVFFYAEEAFEVIRREWGFAALERPHGRVIRLIR